MARDTAATRRLIPAGAIVLAAAYCRRGERHRIASVLADCPMGHPPCDTASFTRNAAASWLAPAKWVRWAWAAYVGTESAAGLRAALDDVSVLHLMANREKERTVVGFWRGAGETVPEGDFPAARAPPA